MYKTSWSDLNEWEAERSPHEPVDDRVDTRVDIWQAFGWIYNLTRNLLLVAIAIRHNDAIELVGQPCDAEGRCNDHAHPGDFASCLLLCRRSSPDASLCANLNSKHNCCRPTRASSNILDKCKKLNSLKHCVRGQITRLKLQKSFCD